MFAFKGGKGTLHAGVVKKVQISWWQSEKWGGADDTVTGFRQEKAQDSATSSWEVRLVQQQHSDSVRELCIVSPGFDIVYHAFWHFS